VRYGSMWWVPDEVKYFHNLRLRHSLDDVVELCLFSVYALDPELGFNLGEPSVDVVGPEGRELHCDCLALVRGGLRL